MDEEGVQGGSSEQGQVGCGKTMLKRWNSGGPHLWENRRIFPQDAQKVRQRHSRVAKRLNVPNENLGGRKRWRVFSVRQDPSQGRTAHTKCRLYLLASLLAAALFGARCVSARQG